MLGYTKTEKKQLQAALNKIQKCNGDCKHCEKCHMYTSAINERSIVYAFGCDYMPEKFFDAISESMKTLKAECVETLEFELA